ncbi:mitochondrial phosphate carrier protein [Gamsiella multidivaricata]|nr:mitochondrial phosphate carrier protein [Gamsiella multidivaricata]
MAGTFRQVIANEGAGALWTGFGPTFIGYSLQGGFKFGGYELWKKIIIDQIGTENATNNRTAVYLAASGVAEFIADIALCPLEATRIRLVSQPTFASGLVSGFRRIRTEEGIYRGFYSGFVPIVFKQKLSSTAMTGVNLGAGLIAGIAAAIVSQPADTLLSKINKAKGTGSAASRLAVLATELGFRGLFLGLGPRIVLVGVLTSLQFGIYGDLKKVFGATNGVEIRKI